MPYRQEDFTGYQAVGQLQGTLASGGGEDQHPAKNSWSSDTPPLAGRLVRSHFSGVLINPTKVG